jgi:purine-nucleoside phosphorylase
MMDYNDLISGMKRFGACDEDVCINSLGIASNMIHDDVVITPGWEPQRVPGLGKAELLISSAPLYGSKVWNVKNGDIEMTFIKTGCGAPAFMDTLLPLGMSKCKRIIFISSVGALDTKIGIGDIVIPEYSVCGDGASRYIASDKLGMDVFGEKVYPDTSLLKLLKIETENICNENNVKWHIGKAFCTDTIFAQFPHIDSIINMGCNLVDMETAAAFRAAKLMEKPLVSLFCVSDNTIANKSLISGRTQDDEAYRLFVRREVIPKIILNLIKVGRCT